MSGYAGIKVAHIIMFDSYLQQNTSHSRFQNPWLESAQVNKHCSRNKINAQIYFVVENGLLTFNADDLLATKNQ